MHFNEGFEKYVKVNFVFCYMVLIQTSLRLLYTCILKDM